MVTVEHIGKVAHLEGQLMDYLETGNMSVDFANMGLSMSGIVQKTDKNGTQHTFAEIIGECDPAKFTSIITKEEANTLVISWFTPECCVTCSEFFFQEYVRRFVPDSVFATMGEGWTDQEILQHLVDSKTCKFIKMSTYEGPLFEV